MKPSVKERVENPINKNKAFSFSWLFVCMGTIICNSRDMIVAQKEVMRRNEDHQRKTMEKADNTKYKRLQDAISSYILFRYN